MREHVPSHQGERFPTTPRSGMSLTSKKKFLSKKILFQQKTGFGLNRRDLQPEWKTDNICAQESKLHFVQWVITHFPPKFGFFAKTKFSQSFVWEFFKLFFFGGFGCKMKFQESFAFPDPGSRVKK